MGLVTRQDSTIVLSELISNLHAVNNEMVVKRERGAAVSINNDENRYLE